MVGLDLATRVDLKARLVEPEAVGVGLAADRHEDDVGFQRLRRAALGRLHRQAGLAAAYLHTSDLGAELELDALLLEDLVGFLADIVVEPGQDLVEEFDAGDLGANSPPD